MKRWAAFARFLDDDRIFRSNAAAGRAARGIAALAGNCGGPSHPIDVPPQRLGLVGIAKIG
ncbi:MAG: hypothetical protein ACR2KT_02770 [Methylocella sp.]|nr:MAG: hypothetical protein DLM68_15060 [Hyphomicrobiales bacterium]